MGGHCGPSHSQHPCFCAWTSHWANKRRTLFKMKETAFALLVLIFIGYSVAEISEDTERSFETEEDLLEYLDDRDMELERNLDLDRDLEVEDRPGLTKAGQNKGFNVTCKKWTSRLVTGTPGAVGYLNSSGDMKRCTVQYKLAGGCTEIMFACDDFYVPNDDAWKCTKGSAFHTKADSTPVRDFCKRQGPDYNFPVLGMSGLKLWYVNDKGFNGRFSCKVVCSQ